MIEVKAGKPNSIFKRAAVEVVPQEQLEKVLEVGVVCDLWAPGSEEWAEERDGFSESN